MGDAKKKPSGAQFKKRAHEKAERAKDNLRKIPKIKTFFSTNASATSILNAEPLTNDEIVISDNSSKSTEVQVCRETNQENQSAESSNGNTAKVTSKCDDHIGNKDPAKWKVDKELCDYVAQNGVDQNSDLDFSNSARHYSDKTRYISKSIFNKILKNGETVKRLWPIFSPSTGAIYCGPCKLFGGITQFATTGFSDWKNSARVDEHEKSPDHHKCVMTLITRGKTFQRIDRQLIVQLEDEINYWQQVLLRVVEVIKYFVSRGLSFNFKGHVETFGSLHNGNFLGILELLAKFDPFLADHIARFGNSGRGTLAYMSSTVVNELILQMGNQVKTKIVDELRVAKYYSISVDSTPDVTHVDQLTFILRYVIDGTPVERFICFIPNAGHTGKQMLTCIMDILNSLQIDISDCRGQSYDNASNMSGQYSGLQARIKALNPLAIYIPCSAHSLNLVGLSAVESCKQAVDFFLTVQTVFNFFSASPHRWKILKSFLKAGALSLKGLSGTRWSARADASKALFSSYHEIISALLSISEDETEKASTKLEAKSIANKLGGFDIVIMVCFWNRILERFNEVSKKLQSTDIDLDTVIKLYDSLHGYVSSLRNEFDVFESQAVKMCGSNCKPYDSEIKRKSIRTLQADETRVGDTQLKGREHYRISLYLPIIDKLLSELAKRREAYKTANNNFGFLATLKFTNNERIREHAIHLVKEYSGDLDSTLPEECLQLKSLLLSTVDDVSRPIKLLKWLKNQNFGSVFSNVEIALRMYLTTALSNCSGERSFSTLKRVKTYLRSGMTDDKLFALALLSIEAELLQSIDFKDIVKQFAESKARRKPF